MATAADPSPQFINVDENSSKLEMLAHVHEFSKLAVLFVGRAGVGKSTLLRQLEQQLSIHHQVLALSALEYNQLDDIIYALAQHLGCMADLAEIEQAMHHMHQQEERLHLIVDDAQLLDESSLTFLLSKSQSAQGWQLLLCGEPSLQQQCEQAEKSIQQESILHAISLDPLSEEGCTQFLQGIYKRVGIDTLPLSSKAIHHYWRLSEGLPAKLLDIVDTQASEQTPLSKLPFGHIAAAILVGAALLISIAYKPAEEPPLDDDAIARLIAGEAVVTEETDKNPVVEKKISSEIKKSQVESEEPSKDIAMVGNSAVESESEVVGDDSKAHSSGQPNSIESVNSEPSSDGVSEASQNHPLLAAVPTDYGLQLVGVRSEASALQVVEKFSAKLGKDKLSIYETRYKGAPWYVVVYAPIANKSLANDQAKQLSSMLSTQPWVRPMAKIQEDIRKNTN